MMVHQQPSSPIPTSIQQMSQDLISFSGEELAIGQVAEGCLTGEVEIEIEENKNRSRLTP